MLVAFGVPTSSPVTERKIEGLRPKIRSNNLGKWPDKNERFSGQRPANFHRAIFEQNVGAPQGSHLISSDREEDTRSQNEDSLQQSRALAPDGRERGSAVSAEIWAFFTDFLQLGAVNRLFNIRLSLRLVIADHAVLPG